LLGQSDLPFRSGFLDRVAAGLESVGMRLRKEMAEADALRL
jgi:hypothetical protein